MTHSTSIKVLLGELSGEIENDVRMTGLAITLIERALDRPSDLEKVITVIARTLH